MKVSCTYIGVYILATKHEMILEVKVLGGRMGTIHLGMVILNLGSCMNWNGIIFSPLWFEVQWCIFLEGVNFMWLYA